MKHHVPLLLAWIGVAVSAAGESLNNSYILTTFGGLMAALASAVAIFVKFHEWRRIRLEQEHLKQVICEECKRGLPPGECPYDQSPESCPKRKSQTKVEDE